MPTSHHYQISKIIDLIMKIKPKSILDIGVGFGKYGVLCREFLELWDKRQEYNKFIRKIDGIEAFKEFITPLHKYIYDDIYIGNAFEIIDDINHKYDLILLIDVLEHFDKDIGIKFINKLKKKGKSILISTPKIVGLQKNSFSNIYESHRSSWTKKELERIGPHIFIYDKKSHIYYFDKKESLNYIKEKLINSYLDDLYTIFSRLVKNPIKTFRLSLLFILRKLFKIFSKN